jgi:predicted NBD/HSP70 family sugar kinase
MYLGIDIGGTKTLIATLTNEGVITEELKFPTPKNYDEFLKELEANLDNIKTLRLAVLLCQLPASTASMVLVRPLVIYLG